MGTKTVLESESFAFFDNYSRFMTTEYYKARITALALLIRVSSSSSCQNLLKNTLFFGKCWKNRRSIGGSTPQPPLASSGWGLCPQNPKLFPLNLRVIL